MKRYNWVDVPEAGQGGSLEPGWYVVRITDAIDHPAEEFLDIVFDVADGPCAGKFSDQWGADNLWAHSFRRYYSPDPKSGKMSTSFSGFLGALERSNQGRFSKAAFSANSNERSMVGLLVGIAVQSKTYTNREGADAQGVEVRFTCDAAEVATKTVDDLPKPRDLRKGAEQAQAYAAPAQPQGFSMPAPAAPAQAPVGFASTMTPQAMQFAQQQAQGNGYVPF